MVLPGEGDVNPPPPRVPPAESEPPRRVQQEEQSPSANGWRYTGNHDVNEQDMQHATVEPWPPHLGHTPREIRLVGPTCTSWSKCIGRLTWDSARGPDYYRCIVSAKRRTIAGLWRPAPARPHTMLPRAQAVADELGRHRKLTLGIALRAPASAANIGPHSL
eukprot:SAG25_NODE_57_length_18482_cov_39.198063_1_plen_162_part_00